MTPVLCKHLDTPARSTSRIDAAGLTEADCEVVDEDELPTGELLEASGSTWIYNTGFDRTNIASTSDGNEVSLTVGVPGPSCVTTADYRGQLSAVVHGDNGAAEPQIEVAVEEQDC